MKSARRRPTLDEIEEAADVIHQRNQLYRIREFLRDNEGDCSYFRELDGVSKTVEPKTVKMRTSSWL